MLTATNSAQYVYDAFDQRVEKLGGSNPTEVVYFNGHPIALLNPSSGAWTDLIWAGSNLLAEVPGSQTAVPVYRLLDHEGSLVATTDASGNVTGTNLLMPYGETLASNTNDPYAFAGLYQDTEYGGDDAWYRNYSTEQSRWLTPDPYNGSYDLNNPQSFNRYMYVNGNPLGYVDPSGLSVASTLCSALPAFFLSPKDFASDISKLVGYSSQVSKGSCTGTLESFGLFVGKQLASFALVASFPLSSTDATYTQAEKYFSVVQADVTIGCSIDYNSTVCGAPQLAWLIPGAGGDIGKAAGDVAAVGYAICAVGGFSNAASDAFALYEIANSVYGFLYNLFGWGPAQFTGSLLPRPTALGGLGTSPIGIPNQNLNLKQLLGQR
ncbi:MAG: RHS repeat domain-containing protein [Acidobacteriaceae bacterium]